MLPSGPCSHSWLDPRSLTFKAEIKLLKNQCNLLKVFWSCYFPSQNKSNAPSENDLALLCASGDQGEWNLGQDDSALHGKHLPPSPRKRVSSSGFTESLFILKEENTEKPFCADSMCDPAVVEKPASTSGLGFQPASPEASQVGEGEAEVKETLSQASESLLLPSTGSRQSTFVPWEKAGKEPEAPTEGGGLLQEVVSLCHFQQGLNISEGNRSEDQT